jgi:choline kinase
MQAVILAAGTSSRMQPITKDFSKAMLTIGERSLISRTIDNLQKNGITNIVVVLGYQYDVLVKHLKNEFPGIGFLFVVNPEYENKNNIYSMHLAAPSMKGQDVLIINCDLFCEERIYQWVIHAAFDTMAVDSEVEFDWESTKVTLDNEDHVCAVSKDLPPHETNGEYIGMLKLRKESTDLFIEEIARMVQAGETDVWYPYALRKILPQSGLKATFTQHLAWEEIDTPQDYARAQEKAAALEHMEHTPKMDWSMP